MLVSVFLIVFATKYSLSKVDQERIRHNLSLKIIWPTQFILKI